MSDKHKRKHKRVFLGAELELHKNHPVIALFRDYFKRLLDSKSVKHKAIFDKESKND